MNKNKKPQQKEMMRTHFVIKSSFIYFEWQVDDRRRDILVKANTWC
jgi:hypothetical protein